MSFVLKAPEELQGQLVGQEHGGAHWEASDGVYRRSTEKHLQLKRKTFPFYSDFKILNELE